MQRVPQPEVVVCTNEAPVAPLAPEVQALVDAAYSRVNDVSDGPSPVAVIELMAPRFVREIRSATRPEVQGALFDHAAALFVGLGGVHGVACKPFLREGMVDAAFDALRDNGACTAAASSALFILGHMALAMPREQQFALVHAALATLSKVDSGLCLPHAATEANAMVALMNVTSNDNETRSVARSRGAVRMLLAALCRHRGSEHVQFSGCAALHGVTGYNDPRELPESVGTGVVDAALRALRGFPASPPVQKHAALLLGTYAQRSTVQLYAMREGVVTLLTAGLGTHLAVGGVCEAACYALAGLKEPFFRSKVPRLEAQAALYATVAALQAHPTLAPTQEWGVRAVATLSRHTMLADSASSRALTAVMSTLHDCADDMYVQSACCMTLAGVIALHRDAAVAQGVVPLLLGALRAGFSRVAADYAAFPDYHQRYPLGPAAYPIIALAQLFARVGNEDDSRTDAFVDAEYSVLHGGALGLLQLKPTNSDDLVESKRKELVQRVCGFATDHVQYAPACVECAALRARGVMCGRRGCAAFAPSGSDAPAATDEAWARTGRMQRCSRCGVAAYCCRAHQVESWPEHKKVCAAAAATRRGSTKAAAKQ